MYQPGFAVYITLDRTEERVSPRNRIVIFGCLAVALALLPIFAYVGMFGAKWSTSQEAWGQFGDFFGGFLNPLYALLAFVAVVNNLHLQSEQLEIARNEFRAAAAATQMQIDAIREQASREELVSIIHALSDAIESILNEAVSPSGSLPVLQLRHVVHEGWRLRALPPQGGPYREYVNQPRSGGSLVEALHNRLRVAADGLANFLPIYGKMVGQDSPILRYYTAKFLGIGLLLAEVGGTSGQTIEFFRNAERASAV